jgi:hypothetical protein
METKIFGIGLIAVLALGLISIMPVSANSPPHVGDFTGDGQVTFSDVIYLKMMGEDDMGWPHHAPFTGQIWDNPDVNQDGEFTYADVWLLWRYMEWYPHPDNPYTIYPNTGYQSKYPIFNGMGYYYDCMFSSKYPGCSTASSWQGYITCLRGSYYDQLEGRFTA